MKVIFNITENKNKATFQQEVVKINTSFNQTQNIVKPKFQIGYYPLPGGGGGDLSNYYTKDETYSKTEVDDIIADIPVVDTSNLVPYTGANKDVNIASNYFKTSKGFDFTKENPYEKEAIKRFGTKAVAQTKEKIDSLSNDGKQKISDQMNQLFHDLENLKDENPAATIAQAAIANMYHTFNDTLGYHYTLEAFAGLGQLYVQDERFTENLRQYGDGFPEFLAAAMTYYAQKT